MAEENQFLSRIQLSRRLQIQELKATLPLSQLMKNMSHQSAHRFREALQIDGIRIIAELKKASPSRGVLIANFDIPLLASQYAKGKAAALSVLTEPTYFMGKSEYMHQAKEASGLPVLCKDFIFDTYQIYHARVMQADAVLLICRILNDEQMRQYIKLAESLGMDALVETHSAEECKRAIDAGATIVGVNARNLETFDVDIQLLHELRGLIPSSYIAVAESGIQSRTDIDSLKGSGYRHFLVGESLVRHTDPAVLLREMVGP